MNNIDILEKELKELCKSGKRIKIEDMKRIFVACDLIETLIAENKELKEENEELKIIKSGIQALETNFANDDTYYVIGKRGFFKGEYRKLLDDYIPKSKVEELLKEIQEEGKIAYKNFMNKKLEEDFEIDGAILQEFGYIEGKLQSLLGKD